MLHAYRAFDAPHTRIVPPRLPTDDELATFHTREYIDVVRRLSRGELMINATRYNFGSGDNPVFEGMFESESLKVGAALVGTELLLQDEVEVVFSFAGGLHHAGRDFASGFCVFGDGAVAIQRMLAEGWRVAYIDIDAHHGDGVQAAFYDEPRVLTISFHESGRALPMNSAGEKGMALVSTYPYSLSPVMTPSVGSLTGLCDPWSTVLLLT
jgi:acetoin utilization protein AcuC